MKVDINVDGKPKNKMSEILLPTESKDISYYTEEQKCTYLKNLIKLFFLRNYEKDFQDISSIIETIEFNKYITLLNKPDYNIINLLTVDLYLAFRAENINYISEIVISDGICKILHY